jgi:hypothetical protein
MGCQHHAPAALHPGKINLVVHVSNCWRLKYLTAVRNCAVIAIFSWQAFVRIIAFVNLWCWAIDQSTEPPKTVALFHARNTSCVLHGGGHRVTEPSSSVHLPRVVTVSHTFSLGQPRMSHSQPLIVWARSVPGVTLSYRTLESPLRRHRLAVHPFTWLVVHSHLMTELCDARVGTGVAEIRRLWKA